MVIAGFQLQASISAARQCGVHQIINSDVPGVLAWVMVVYMTVAAVARQKSDPWVTAHETPLTRLLIKVNPCTMVLQ